MAQPIIPLPPEEATTETGELVRPMTPPWVDALMLVVVLAIVYGVLRAVMTWRAPLNNGTRVSLDLWHLPLYAALSTLRMALVYAKIAAASKTAERFMLPLLDILQSIPILSFMPGVVIGLASLFPGRALGL